MSPSAPAAALPVGVIAANAAGFALSLAAWVLFGPSAHVLSEEFGLSHASAALLKAVPILVGSVARVPAGMLTDRLGARLMFPLLLVLGALAALTISVATTTSALFAGGALLGLVGATFAVGVQSVTAWTPAGRHGTALGLFGAGNVGLALTTFGLPWLLAAVDWRVAFRIYALMMAVAAAAYALVVRDPAGRGAAPAWREVLAPLARARTWRFGLYYMACFGVVVGGSLVLGDLYVHAYQIDDRTAGALVTTLALTASLMRIVGGRLADGLGPRRVVRWSLLGGGVALVPVALGAPVEAAAGAMLLGGAALGVAMGATMKYVTQYFPQSVGTVGGIVGALGGLGAFALPLLADAAETASGSAFSGVVPMVVLIAAALAIQHRAVGRLRHTSSHEDVDPAGLKVSGASPDKVVLCDVQRGKPLIRPTAKRWRRGVSA